MIRPETIERMQADMAAMYASLPEGTRAQMLAQPDRRAALSLWWRVVADRTQPDEAPRFHAPYNHKRVLPFVERFEVYPDGADDRALSTALVGAWQMICGRVGG